MLTPLPPIAAFHSCLSCPVKPQVLDLAAEPHPGFGGAYLGRNDSTFYALGPDDVVMDCEDRAAGDPEQDWRLHIEAPLYAATYQRQDEGLWVLVARGEGFA